MAKIVVLVVIITSSTVQPVAALSGHWLMVGIGAYFQGSRQFQRVGIVPGMKADKRYGQVVLVVGILAMGVAPAIFASNSFLFRSVGLLFILVGMSLLKTSTVRESPTTLISKVIITGLTDLATTNDKLPPIRGGVVYRERMRHFRSIGESWPRNPACYQGGTANQASCPQARSSNAWQMGIRFTMWLVGPLYPCWNRSRIVGHDIGTFGFLYELG